MDLALVLGLMVPVEVQRHPSKQHHVGSSHCECRLKKMWEQVLKVGQWSETNLNATDDDKWCQ